MTNGTITYEQVLSVLDHQYRSAAELAVRLGLDDIDGVRERCEELVGMRRVRKMKPIARSAAKYRIGW